MITTTARAAREPDPGQVAPPILQLPAPRKGPSVAFVTTLLLLFNIFSLYRGTLAGRLYVLGFLLLVPGALLLSLVPARPKELSVRVAWALGTSLLILMLLGLIESLVLPVLGITAPLRTAPLLVGVDLVVLLALVAGRGRDPLDFLLRGATPSTRDLLVATGAALLPVAAVAGAERLNNARGGSLTVAVMVVGAMLLLGVLIGADRVQARTVSLTLFATTASFLLLSSMRSTHPYGYDIQSEFQVFSSTLQTGVWHIPANGNAYASMLSITILPTVLSILSGTSSIYLFKFFYPVVFAIFPVLIYVTAARLFPRRPAFVGATVVIVQGLFVADITGLARQEIGLLYFGLLVVSAFDPALSHRWRQAGVVLSMSAMAVSHYSSAYFATIVLVGGYILALASRLITRYRTRPLVISGPVVALGILPVVLWNVVITRSAGNISNVVGNLATRGLGLLPGTTSQSLVHRFLNAILTPQVGVRSFVALAIAHYRKAAPFIHPYPSNLTSHYPVHPVAVSGAVASGELVHLFGNAGTIGAELLLLLIVLSVLTFAWRTRENSALREVATLALACLALVGILRVSSTLSSLYDASRGLVQAAPLFSVGIALVCSWMFSRSKVVATSLLAITSAVLMLLLFTNSGLLDLASGGAPDTFTNRGEAYQRYYITDADIASAQWVVDHQRPGQVVYADVYAALQIWEFNHINGLETTVIPQVIEPEALVYASSTNIVDGTTRSLIGNDFSIYTFPRAFLDNVKDVVFTTGDTEVFQ